MKEAITEFHVPPELKEHGVFRIAKEGSTILIQMINGSGSSNNSSRQLTSIRFDIEPSWQKTAANFEKQSKGLIADLELKQALIFYLTEQWLNLVLDGNGHTSTTTFTFLSVVCITRKVFVYDCRLCLLTPMNFLIHILVDFK